MKQWKLVAVPADVSSVMVSLIHSQSAPNVDWPVVAGSPAGTRYSALKQINASNVNQLKVVWTYDVSDARAPSRPTRSKSTEFSTAIQTDRRFFASTPQRQQIWLFDSVNWGAATIAGYPIWRGGSDERIFAGIASMCTRSMRRLGNPIPSSGRAGVLISAQIFVVVPRPQPVRWGIHHSL